MKQAWVRDDDKEIIEQGFEWMKNPKKKYRLGDWVKATENLAKLNKQFNAGTLGLTIEEFNKRGLK